MGVRLVPKTVIVAVSALALLGTATAGASVADDTSIARAGLLTAEDFTADWQSQKPDPSDNDVERIAEGVSTCRGYLALRTAAHKNPRAKSQDFVRGDDQVSNTVNMFSTTAGATDALAEVRKPAVTRCLRTVFDKAIRENIADDPAARKQVASLDIRVGRLDVPAAGDEVVAFEVVVSVRTKSGATSDVYLDQEFVRVGRAIDSFNFQAEEHALADTAGYIETSVGRLRAALA
jgi:hypothetical protein